MTRSIILGAGFGFALGLTLHVAASFILKRAPSYSPEAARSQVLGVFMVRLFTSAALLFALREDIPMMLSALFGIILARNCIVVKFLMEQRGGNR